MSRRAESMPWPRGSWRSPTTAAPRLSCKVPCTYEVESASGGYLSLGKLTARVEEGGGQGSEPPFSSYGIRGARGERTANPLLSQQEREPTTSLAPRPSAEERGEGERSIHYPLATIHLFTVRTPTAVVTDLGTEFGVEVDRSGRSLPAFFREGSSCVRPKTRREDAARSFLWGPTSRPAWNRAGIGRPERFPRQSCRRRRLSCVKCPSGRRSSSSTRAWA